MTEGYEKHLTELHAKQTVPAEVVDDILGVFSSAPVVAKQRIIAGEINEVYDVAFADAVHVIVRISHDEDQTFEHAQWAIRECALRGVPVPEVLGVWDRSTSNQLLHICIQRKLEGVLLAKANLPHNVLRQIVAQAGGFLSRIHTIPTNGFGNIDGTGKGTFLTAQSEIDAFVRMESEFQALAQRLDLSRRAMSRALQLVVDDGRVMQPIDPCLTHNDFSAKHILVANGAVSGIIDFGQVAGSEPLSDLVRWDYYDAARFPFEWLQEGYTNKQVFDEQFTQRLRVKRIGFSLWVMRWYDRGGYAEGVADARTKFVQDLAHFE